MCKLNLAAGTNYGEISVWDVGTRERIVYKPFKVWDLSSSSMSFRVMFLYHWLLSIFIHL